MRIVLDDEYDDAKFFPKSLAEDISLNIIDILPPLSFIITIF